MRALTLFLIALSLSSPLCGAAKTGSKSEPFTERTPAYFVDRYGSGDPSKTVPKYSFVDPKRGNVEINGQFSVRAFRSGDLRVKAVFNLSSLKLASVRLQLPRQWTPEQIQSALMAYGSDWKPVGDNFMIQKWATPTGLRAIYMLTFVEIQSPEIAKSVEQVLAAKDRERKAIPKF